MKGTHEYLHKYIKVLSGKLLAGVMKYICKFNAGTRLSKGNLSKKLLDGSIISIDQIT